MARAASDSGSERRPPRSTSLRRQLVEQLEREGSLKSPAVREAFLAVPRERFLPEVVAREGLEAVYRNRAIVTTRDECGMPTSSSSQPSIMAPMLERLDLGPGQRVLEVGAGSGYNAALLARLVGAEGRVVSIELEQATARAARRALADCGSRARVVRGDGRAGWPRSAPYDRIIVTASASTVSAAWFEQLAEGGLLELPLWVDRTGDIQAVVTLRKHASELRSVAVIFGSFMPLRMGAGAPAPVSGLYLSASERRDGRQRLLAHVGGEALRGMSIDARRRLLSLALSETRVRQLGMRAARGPLLLYMAVESPPSLFSGSWVSPGLISEGGSGLAFLAGKRTLTRIESAGDSDAERVLLELVERWKQRGRPTERELRVEVGFRRRGGASTRWSWTSRRSRRSR